MAYIGIDEKTFTINNVESEDVTYDEHLEPIILKFKDNAKKWLVNTKTNKFADAIEDVKSFIEDVEVGLCERQKIVCLYEIENEYEDQTNYPVFEPILSDEEFLEDAIIRFISEEWAIDKDLLKFLKDY